MFATRMQNLAITLDKVKHFLQQQRPEVQQAPPLRLLRPEEVNEVLWLGEQSLMRHLMRTLRYTMTDEPSLAVLEELQAELQRTQHYQQHPEEIRPMMLHCRSGAALRRSSRCARKARGDSALPPRLRRPLDPLLPHPLLLRQRGLQVIPQQTHLHPLL